ncbi:tail fiber assembly protein [Morganella morganii]
MNTLYAVIENGIVVNVIIWDGESEIAVPDERQLINISDIDDNPGIGWSYSDGEFTSPPPPELSHAELVEQAEVKKQYLIAEVHTETEMRRVKLALKRIKPDEEARLIAWLDYLDELEAVEVSTAPDIIWPEKPE